MRVGANPPGNDWPTALRAGDDWQFGRAAEILEFIYVSFRRLIPYDRIGLALLDPATDTLHSVWQRADDPQLLLPKNYAGAVGETSLGAFLQSGLPRIINDLVAHAQDRGGSPHSQFMRQRGVQSSLTCPLVGADGAFGVLFFSSRQAHAYRDDHIDVLLQIAKEVAALLDPAASERTRFGDVLAHLALQLDAIHQEQQLLRALTDRLADGVRLETIGEHLFEALSAFLPFDFLSIALFEDDGTVLRERWARARDTHDADILLAVGKIDGTTLVPVVEQQRPRIVNDLREFVAGHPFAYAVRDRVARGFRSNMACPLVVDGKVIGMVFLTSRQLNGYEPAHAVRYQRVIGAVSSAVERVLKLESAAQEHAFTDALLSEMVPERVLRRLKLQRRTVAEHVPDAGVLFVDIVGFTSWSPAVDPHKVVEALDGLFRAFDDICRDLGVQKLRTIGDAYVVVSGIATGDPDHLLRLVKAALRMVNVAEQHLDATGKPIAVRAGLASGELVAGVLGGRVPHYDVWGPTVNLASRIEHAAQPGTVHVDPITAERIRLEVDAASLGPKPLRGFGSVEVFSVG